MRKKYAFVRFLETGVTGQCAMLVSGDPAADPEAFIQWHNPGNVTVTAWFGVPESWANEAGPDTLNDAFEALVALDALGDTPAVSDLLATIFVAGCDAQDRFLEAARRLRG